MYYDSLNAMFRGAEKDFQDPVYKLWYWNTSASFKKTPAGYPMFWGPGNAWVIGGVVRALKYMPKDSKYRPAWEATFKTFCDTLRIKQQPDGFWRTSLFEPTEYPDPESSCTAFFIYAMSLGVYWGILDSATYIPVIRKGWSALVKVVSPNGKVGYGQPTSNHPAPVSLNNELPEGHGSFLLAGEGVYLISNGQAVTSAPAMLTERKICGLGKVREVFLKGSLTFQVPENAKNLSIFDFSGKEWWRQAIPQMSRGKLIVLPKSALRNNVALLRFF
jgi:hypothetical protein